MKKKLIDKYLELEESFVKNVLNDSYSVNEFWKKLNIGAPLRTNRGGNQWKQFEDKFGIQIRQTINLNIEKQNAQQQLIELNKDRVCKNPRCKNHFTWKEHPNSDFCSKSCAASYSAQHADPKNIRNGMKNSFKDVPCAGGCGKILHILSFTNKVFCDDCFQKHYNNNICPVCGKQIIGRKYRKTCSPECGKKLRIETFKITAKTNHKCGGLRTGAGHGKHGWYKGYWCDSSWELAWVIYNIEHGISFKRNKQGFLYTYNGKQHKYYPDFILSDGTYIEIKGYQFPNWKAKVEQISIPLKIYFEDDLKDIFEYVKTKYGNDFTYLYDK